MCHTRCNIEGGVGALRERESDDTNFLKPNGQSRNLNIYASSRFLLVLRYEVAKVPRSDFLTPHKSSADMVTSNDKILSM